jgi:hypothetical protein
MASAIDYRGLARECIQEAESTQDEARKKTLLGIAKLYNQTALNMEAGNAPPADQTDGLARKHGNPTG